MKTKAVAVCLLPFSLLLSAAPSFAAPAAPTSPDGQGTYQQAVTTLQQMLADNYLLGTRRRARLEINLHTAEWLHQQGKDQQALSYLDFAIGQASLPY